MAMDWGRHLGGQPDKSKVTTERVSGTRTDARKAAGRVGALSGIGKQRRKP